MTDRFSVVIPSDSLDNLSKSVKTVFDTHRDLDPASVIVVSGSITAADLPDFLRGVTLITDDRPFIYGRRTNMGILEAGSRDLVIMGDDVEVVTENAFGILSREAPFRLLAASVLGRVGPPWQKDLKDHEDVPFVSFTCVYLPRGLQEIVGSIEERFPGYGFEDTDYCIRIRRKGFSCGVKADVIVKHTVNIPSHFLRLYPNIVEMEDLAREAFIAKHKEGTG